MAFVVRLEEMTGLDAEMDKLDVAMWLAHVLEMPDLTVWDNEKDFVLDYQDGLFEEE
jgi:hypothetical protein